MKSGPEHFAQLEGETTSDALMGVTVEYTGDAYDGKEMQLLVSEDVYAADYFAKDYNKVVAWDIKTLVDGSEVQPDVPVLVSLTIPADFDRNSIAVYHVNSATGFTEEITPVIVEGNTVKFLAESFSTYIIVDESSEISITEKMNIKFAKLFKLFTILLPDVLDLLVKLLMML